MREVVVLAAALAIDAVFGDPPGRLHPVSWIGTLYARGRDSLSPGAAPWRLVVNGGVLTLVVAAAAAGGAGVLAWTTRDAGTVGLLVDALALKATLALRGLVRAAAEVRHALAAGDLVAARAAVGLHLVSRPTADLDAPGVASATIESVAENLTDAVVAPVGWFLVFGLPGAFAYRAINTADAMIGYREGPLEYYGKLAARVDDALNIVPARLAALALVVAAAVTGRDARGAAATMWRHRGRTASPNAGWTMAAMAGAVGVVLEKVGAYRLGAGRLPDAADIGAAVRLTLVAAGLVVVALMAVRSVI